MIVSYYLITVRCGDAVRYSGTPLEDVPLQHPLSVFAWHPTQPVIAVATDADRIFLYRLSTDSTERVKWKTEIMLQSDLQCKVIISG